MSAIKLTEEQKKLVENNYKLVYYVYQKYIPNTFPNKREHENDLVGEGNWGLICAAANWDSSKGVQFTTYAVKCILNSMRGFMRSTKKHAKVVNSLDEPLKADSTLSLGDVLDSGIDFLSTLEQAQQDVGVISCCLRAIDNLRPKERMAVINMLKGNTQKQLADKMGISSCYVGKLYKTGMSKLKKVVFELYYTEE